MNIDQLLDSLGENDPNPLRVMTQVEHKRRIARNRLYTVSGGLAAVAAAIVVIAVLPGIKFGSPTSSSSSAASGSEAGGPAAGSAGSAGSAPHAANGAGPEPGPSGSRSAASCAGVPLQRAITMALRDGGSVIVGYGTQTGSSVGGNTAQGGAPAYYAVTLSSVRTLAGPRITSGSTAWVPGAASGASAAGTGSAGTGSSGGAVSGSEGEALWAPDGELFAIVSPQAAGSPNSPVLRSAPVIDGKVIFSSYGCWSVTGLPATPYSGGGVQVFGPVHPNGSASKPLFVRGESLEAVPLADVEKVASGH